MAILVTVETTESPSLEDMSKRGVNRVMRGAHKVAGELWQSKFLPRHFTAGAHARYGNYKRRRYLYQQRKRGLARTGKVKKGGRIDLVYTGTLEEMMTRHQIVRAYPTRATIRMPGPNYIGMRPKDPRKPHKADEILAVTPDEHRQIRQAMSEEVAAGIQRETTRKTTRSK